MGASNTPLPDLIELSSLNANATFTVTPGGGGDIEGLVDNATYSDSQSGNTSSHIGELNETYDSDSGSLEIDGVTYNIQLITPLSDLSDPVTVTYDGGASSTDLYGDDYITEVAFIIASPLGGGSDRYFAVFDDSIGDLPDITSIQIRDLDWNPSGDDVKIEVSGDNNVAPVCFLQGTMIRTPLGETRVEHLKPGDLIATVDHGPLPLRWIGARDMVFTEENAHHKPILIKAGSLGSTPTSDLAVSPQHRILLDGPEVVFAHGAAEILAVAKGLTEMRHIRQMQGKSHARYYALMLEQHALIWANGTRAESFYPGQTAMTLLPPKHRSAITKLFPKLTEDAHKSYGPYARPVLNCRDTRNLVRRLSQQEPIRPAAE